MRFFCIILFSLYSLLYAAAQDHFFLPTKDDFLIYSVNKQTVVKALNYHKSSLQGLLWRPTSNMTFIFAKNIPGSAQLMRMRMSDKKIDYYYHTGDFSDFQVINRNFVVIHADKTLCLWNLNTNKCTTLTSDFRGTYFAYDMKRQLLVTQNASNILVLHFLRSEKEKQFLDKVEENTHFTLFQGKLYYFNSNNSWIVYSIDTESVEQYTLAGKHYMQGIWPTNSGFLIKELITDSAADIPGWKLFLYKKDQFFSDEIFFQRPSPQVGGVSIESNSLITPLEDVHLP